MAAVERMAGTNYRIILKRVLIGVAVLVLLPIGGFATFLSFDVFLPIRQFLAGAVISEQLDRPAVVRGAVTFEFGRRMTVHMKDAVIKRPGGDEEAPRRFFEEVKFEAPYRLFLGDVSQISNFQMTKANIDVSDAGKAAKPGNWSYYLLLSDVINMPAFDTLRLSDVTLRYLSDKSGWDEELEIKKLTILPTPQGDMLHIDFDAVFNGTPLQVSGQIARPPKGGFLSNGQFDLVLQFPALVSKVSGTIDTSEPIAVVSGHSQWTSQSLSKLLTSAGIASDLDGTADASWTFNGPLDELEVSDLHVSFRNSSGDTVEVAGTINSASVDPVVDLFFDVALAPIKEPKDRIVVEVLGLSGKLQGPLNGLAVEDAQLVTNAANVNIATVGPITVGRIIKDEAGRIGLEDLVIKDGPPEDPFLVLSGDFQDVVGLSGLTLAGSFRLPVSHFLKAKGARKPDLGVLAGDIAMSDTPEGLSLDSFSGAAVDTNLFNLTFDLVVPELRLVDQLSFSTELQIPDPKALLRETGVEPKRTLPSLSFAGQSLLEAGKLGFSGAMVSGKSQIDATLSLALKAETKAWLLSGAVASERLEIAEVSGLTDFAEISFAEQDEKISVSDDIASDFVIDVDVAAKSLISGNKKAGDVMAKLLYQKEIMQAAKLTMSYLGGVVKGDFGLDFTTEVTRAFAKGRIEKFPFKKLMAEFDVDAPMSSTVYASFDLTSQMGSSIELLKSMNGSLTTSLWGGFLPDRMIDLSGLSAFTWLVSGSSDGRAKLECAVLPLRFKSGRATSKSLVVETANVQIVGGGDIDFRKGTLDLSFLPRAKKKQLVQIVSPFELKGDLKAPDLIVKDAGAGRAVGEVLSFPLNFLGHVFQGSGAIDQAHKPCVIPKNTGPK